uniref:Uncharacterized protein n=1 Tax=Populus trichocarpa TaxID=3694 RepID=A0A2K1R5Y0_POPTR
MQVLDEALLGLPLWLDFWWFICHRLFPFRMRISVAWGVGVLPGLGHQQSRHGWTVGGGF